MHKSTPLPLNNDNQNPAPTHDGDTNEPADVSSAVLDFDPAELEAHRNGKPAASDPFDPASLRLSQDAAVGLGVKKALLSVPVRKPDKSWFVRAHHDEAFRLQTAVIELKEDRETYLVSPALWPALAGESTFSPRALFTAVNRQGVLFVWPVRLPGPDGKVDEWSRTALEAADPRSWPRREPMEGSRTYVKAPLHQRLHQLLTKPVRKGHFLS